jgi:hypothetical protein
MLVILFLSTIFIQALHNHNSSLNTASSQDEQYTSLSEKCKICDDYHHKQEKEAVQVYQTALIVALPDSVDLGTRVLGGIYKFTLQGFTNKGPPAIIA